MIKSSKQISLKDEALPLFSVGIHYFFEREYILLDTLISHLVDSSKATLTQQFLHPVTATYNTSYRESSLYFLHYTPQTLEKSFTSSHDSSLRTRISKSRSIPDPPSGTDARNHSCVLRGTFPCVTWSTTRSSWRS